MSPNETAAKVKKEVQNLLALGLIQLSYSPWASGIVKVKKKSGKHCFCCDFRPLNDETVKDAFPLPRIDESLSRIGNAKIFTSINLAWAATYIDDIAIATETIEDHFLRIREVFECLREAGFKMRAEKCDFMRTETNCRRHIARPGNGQQDPRLDASEKQRRATKLPGVCRILPRLHLFSHC